MASSATYDALVTYIEAAVITLVNAEQTDLLVAGSVSITREPRGPGARQVNAFPVSVEIVPVGPRVTRQVGIGFEEVDHAFDLRIEVRRKDKPGGKSQLDLVEDVARALVRAWQNVSTLSITVMGATFRKSTASIESLDKTPGSAELTRGVVRATFTFTEAQA